MKFIAPHLLSFVKNAQLKSRFTSISKIAKFSNLEIDISTIEGLDPNILFKKLQDAIVEDIDLLQTLNLMGLEDNRWKTQNGYTVARNWWLSALKKEKDGDSNIRMVMVLRTILADTERYPAPKDVIQTMRTSLDKLIELGEWPFKNNIDVLKGLTSQNAKKLAEISYNKSITVLELMQENGYPEKLPIIEEANNIWFMLWFKSPKEKRLYLRDKVKSLIYSYKSIEQHINLTNIIIDQLGLPQQVAILKNEVKKYPEISEWLKYIKNHQSQKNNLVEYYQGLININSRQLLSCWIGVGNYLQLKGMVYQLADMYFNDDYDEKIVNSRNAQKNRYNFWEEYQFLFEEIWLLLPNKFDYISKNFSIDNTRHLNNFKYPLAIFRIGDFYICEPFIAKANQAELFIILAQQHEIEEKLNQKIINFNDLQSFPVILEHDHHNGWQPLLKKELKKRFGIIALIES